MAVKVDMSGVGAKLHEICTNQRLGRFAASTAAHDMERYVPYREGALRSSAVVEPFKVRYNAPYAKYQYNGRFKEYTTPGTGSKWDERINVGDLARAITAWIRRFM